MTQPRHDHHAEQALIAACLTWPAYLDETDVDPSDFHHPRNQHLWAALADMHRHGERIDAITYADRLRTTGLIPDDQITHIVTDLVTLSGTTATAAARIVVRHAVARRLQGAAEELRNAALDPTSDPAEILDQARARLAAIELPTRKTVDGLWSIDDFLGRPNADHRPWVIPGLLRAGWRAMVVAPEGVGKTVLFRQIALLAAQGIHPFTHGPIPATNTLMVDLENPEEAIDDVCNPITVKARRVRGGNYREHGAWLWHRPGGINLRTRVDRGDLEAVIEHVKPAVVAIGPLYKAYRRKAAESDEDAVAEVQAVLDDLRTRHDFALLIEHHAPKKQGGVRDLEPFGSSLWLRWPEFGIKLVPLDDRGNELELRRFRGDRLKAAWPIKLTRGRVSDWPWQGIYPDGTFSQGVA